MILRCLLCKITFKRNENDVRQNCAQIYFDGPTKERQIGLLCSFSFSIAGAHLSISMLSPFYGLVYTVETQYNQYGHSLSAFLFSIFRHVPERTNCVSNDDYFALPHMQKSSD